MGEVGIEARRSSWVIIKRKDIHPSKDASENAPRLFLVNSRGETLWLTPHPMGSDRISSHHMHTYMCVHTNKQHHTAGRQGETWVLKKGL